MMDFSHEEIQDAQNEAMSDAQEEYEDQKQEFRDYLWDDVSEDYSDGFNTCDHQYTEVNTAPLGVRCIKCGHFVGAWET